MVAGRSKQAFKQWLAERPKTWRRDASRSPPARSSRWAPVFPATAGRLMKVTVSSGRVSSDCRDQMTPVLNLFGERHRPISIIIELAILSASPEWTDAGHVEPVSIPNGNDLSRRERALTSGPGVSRCRRGAGVGVNGSRPGVDDHWVARRAEHPPRPHGDHNCGDDQRGHHEDPGLTGPQRRVRTRGGSVETFLDDAVPGGVQGDGRPNAARRQTEAGNDDAEADHRNHE